MPLTIHATKSRDPFARVLKSLLDDKRISWKAKGIAAYLLGKKDGWKLRVTDIERHGPDGKHAVRAAVNELRAFGYARMTALRQRGQIVDWQWEIADVPKFLPLPDFQEVGKQEVGNQHHSKKESTKQDISKKESKESKETPSFDGAGDFDSAEDIQAMWKPDNRSKAQKLKSVKVPPDYPSEREFDDFVASECLDHIGMGKRGDLYSDLCNNKWHHWKHRRWVPLQDWRKYVAGLENSMAEATAGGF